MKSTLLVLVLLSTQLVFANSNPQMRTCRIYAGQFWSLKITSPKDDHIGFCRYNDAMLDSVSFMQYLYEKEVTQAFAAYFSSEHKEIRSCKQVGAKEVIGQETNGPSTRLCVFSDYSFAKKETLLKGWNHPANSELTKVLLEN
tara:strand:+ start:40 stop:468 length:429 start_codon:yes stop_codon:yes gene_type:complete